jgi:hypothetical protein
MPLPSRAGVFGMLRDLVVAEKAGQGRVVAPAQDARPSWPRREVRSISTHLGQHLGLDPEQDHVGTSTASVFRRPSTPIPVRARVARDADGWRDLSGSTSARSMPAIIASAMTPEPTVTIVDLAGGTSGGCARPP